MRLQLLPIRIHILTKDGRKLWVVHGGDDLSKIVFNEHEHMALAMSVSHANETHAALISDLIAGETIAVEKIR